MLIFLNFMELRATDIEIIRHCSRIFQCHPVHINSSFMTVYTYCTDATKIWQFQQHQYMFIDIYTLYRHRCAQNMAILVASVRVYRHIHSVSTPLCLKQGNSGSNCTYLSTYTLHIDTVPTKIRQIWQERYMFIGISVADANLVQTGISFADFITERQAPHVPYLDC